MRSSIFDFGTGTRVTYCPIPTELCIQPSRGIQGDGVGTETTLSLTGNSPFGCIHNEIQLYCRFIFESGTGLGTIGKCDEKCFLKFSDLSCF